MCVFLFTEKASFQKKKTKGHLIHYNAAIVHSEGVVAMSQGASSALSTRFDISDKCFPQTCRTKVPASACGSPRQPQQSMGSYRVAYNECPLPLRTYRLGPHAAPWSCFSRYVPTAVNMDMERHHSGQWQWRSLFFPILRKFSKFEEIIIDRIERHEQHAKQASVVRIVGGPESFPSLTAGMHVFVLVSVAGCC